MTYPQMLHRDGTPREARRFWAVTEGHTVEVEEVTGYDCRPDSPDMWWVPELGFSGREGQHLFPSRIDAIEACRLEIKREILNLEEKLAQLRRYAGGEEF